MSDIVTRLVATIDGFMGPFRQAEQRVKTFEREGTRSLQGFQNQISKIGSVLTAVFVTGAIARAIQGSARLGDELAKMSQKTGLSVETLNGLTQAADLAGVTSEQLTKGIFQLNKNLLDTTRGTGEAKVSFAAMGVGANEAAGLLKVPDQAFLEIAGRLADIKSPSIRAAEAMKIFGKAGAEMLPFLNQGKEAIAAQIVQYQKLRPITTEQALAAEEFNDSLTKLNFAFEGLTQQGVGPALPVLTELIELFTSLITRSDDLLERIASFDEYGVNFGTALRGLASEFIGIDTIVSGLSTTIAHFMELIANPENFKAIQESFEESGRALQEEFIQRQSRLFPEATGGQPKNFSQKPPTSTIPTLDPTVVTEKLVSAELASTLKLKEAELDLLQVQKERDKVIEDSSAIQSLKVYIVQLNEQLTIQKEIEAAAKGNLAVDPNVADTAHIVARTALVKLAEEEKKIKDEQNALEQEGLGFDITSTASQRQALTLRETANRLDQEQHALQLEQLDPQRDALLIRGREIQVIETQIELLRKTNEVMGESPERLKEIEVAQARVNAKILEGRDLLQEGLGRGIVQAATADIEAKLSPFKKAVRDAQLDVDLGKALPNQLDATNKLREIELRKANLALIVEEQRAGVRTGEEASRAFILADAELRAATDDTKKTFVEGWQDAFAQLNSDQRGAFGLGQVLARNFLGDLQQGIGGTISNIFTELGKGTLTWRTALQTIPDILQQITSKLIAMAVVQTITSALGGGGGAGAGIGAALSRGAANPGLFGPGFDTGGSFVVGGRGGADANPILLNLTRGERVNVETEAQQRSSGGGGLMVNINNYAPGVEATVQERETPDGRALDVFVRQKVRNTIEHEYGVSRKPGRVG